MTRKVTYSPRAGRQLRSLYDWLSRAGVPERAEQFVAGILSACEDLGLNPLIGVSRDDILPGLRTIGFRRRVTIAFVVLEKTVEIHGIYYGGRDFEALIHDDVD